MGSKRKPAVRTNVRLNEGLLVFELSAPLGTSQHATLAQLNAVTGVLTAQPGRDVYTLLVKPAPFYQGREDEVMRNMRASEAVRARLLFERVELRQKQTGADPFMSLLDTILGGNPSQMRSGRY